MKKRGINSLLFPLEKRGQFYLVAAVVIIAIVVGFATISNLLQKEQVNEVENIGEDLSLEMQKIYEAGLEQDLDDSDINDMLENFTKVYANETDLDVDFYFVFGDENSLTVSAYRESEITEEEINEQEEDDQTTSDEERSSIVKIKTSEWDKNDLEVPRKDYVKKDGISPSYEKIISLDVMNFQKDFTITNGKNFHFIVFYEDKGERHIISK